MQCEPAIAVPWSPHAKHPGLYRQLFLSRRPGLGDSETLPGIRCEGQGIVPNVAHVAAYRRVCGVPESSPGVPLLYPHALFGSAHLMLLGHPQFPFGSMGILHLRNHCIRYRALDADQPWDMQCELTRQRRVDKGLEFDFDSTVSIAGEVVWKSVSTFLKRIKISGNKETSPLAGLFPALDAAAQRTGGFNVPGDIGKQYARVTGDYNPIHVSTLAAKLFGFKRAIAHGMWAIARTVAQLPALSEPTRMDVAFKGPTFVGSTAHIKSTDTGQFNLFCGKNPRPVIVGLLRTTDANDDL